MFGLNLAIKFGSSEISIYKKGVGIIAKEPAFLAVIENGKKLKVQAVGKAAEELFHSSSSNITVYQPIKNAVVENEKMAILLLAEIVKKSLTNAVSFVNPSALVSIPSGLNEEQLKTLKFVLNQAGIGKVVFVANAVCAYANLDIDKKSHIMVVDIGKTVTDISVLNGYDLDFGRTYFIGGQTMDESITTFIQDNHNLEVSDLTSESAKNEVASLYERDLYSTEYIGIDENNKFVKHNITANEIRVAIQNVYDTILGLVNEVLKLQPKEIAAEIYSNGVMFVGGGSQISGLYEYAKKKLDMPIVLPENPMDSVICGAGKLLGVKDFAKIEL